MIDVFYGINRKHLSTLLATNIVILLKIRLTYGDTTMKTIRIAKIKSIKSGMSQCHGAHKTWLIFDK